MIHSLTCAHAHSNAKVIDHLQYITTGVDQKLTLKGAHSGNLQQQRSLIIALEW